jgi:hypothetical protein
LKQLNSILLILALFLNIQINGQSDSYSSAYRELVYVHLDKQVYVAGEVMHYKVYVADAAHPGQVPCSKIVYFILRSIDNRDLLSWRVNIDSNSVAGSYSIPANVKQGMYVLTAYTNWMRNGPPEELCTQKVLVLNLSEDNPGYLRILPYRDSLSGERLNEDVNNIKIKLSGNSFKTNERVVMEIEVENDAELSVAVTPFVPFNRCMDASDIVSCMPVTIAKPAKANASMRNREVVRDDCVYPVEDKGYILSGKISGIQDMKPLVKGRIWLAIADSISPTIGYAIADSSGRFVFYLNRIYDNKDLILQLVNPSDPARYKIELDDKLVPGSDTASTYLFLKPDDGDFLNTVKNIRLVEAVYNERQNISPGKMTNRGANYFGHPDRVVYMREYADMMNFREIASNILPEVKFMKRNETFYLQVLSPNANIWKDCKIILLNGVPFTDMTYLSTLGSKDIERIEILQANILAGDFALAGLVSVYTYDNKIPAGYLNRNTLSFKNTVITGNGENRADKSGTDKGHHYPDFRNSIFWDPDVKVSGHHKMSIDFPLSLLTGQFEITINGMTIEGIPVSARAFFEVTE